MMNSFYKNKISEQNIILLYFFLFELRNLMKIQIQLCSEKNILHYFVK